MVGLGVLIAGGLVGVPVVLAGGLLRGASAVAEWAGEGSVQRAVLLVAVLAVGFLLFLMRERARLVYGITEIVAALLLAWHAATTAEPVAAGGSLLTALYVVVRGFDNIARWADQRRAEDGELAIAALEPPPPRRSAPPV